MFLINKFWGDNYDRMNKIIDSFNDMTTNYINLEACCSYPFPNVLEAQKAPIYLLPTEGTVGNRYFPNMDSIEEIDIYAEELLLDLFELNKSEFGASIQPHSGTQANQIVYNAVLDDGDCVLSLDPKSGGHISHNKFCKRINVVNYEVTENNTINYALIEEKMLQFKPKLVIIGASSFANEIDYKKIIRLAHENAAYVLADLCHTVLYVLGKSYPSPFPDVDFVTFTMDKTLRGPQGGILIYKKAFERKVNYSIFPLTQGGPLQSLQFAKLACLIELKKLNLSEYAHSVQENAKIMNKVFTDNNISTYSNDSKTHIILINTKQFGLSGLESEELLFKNHILANKNIVPYDNQKPEITSGVRLGTTYITNQNYCKSDIERLTKYIIGILNKKSTTDDFKYFVSKYNN